MVWDDMQKNDMVWPTIAETKGYRQQVYDKISEIIATHPCLEDCAWKSEQDDLKGTLEAYHVVTEAEHHMMPEARDNNINP